MDNYEIHSAQVTERSGGALINKPSSKYLDFNCGEARRDEQL